VIDDILMDRIKAHRSAPDVYDPPSFEDMAKRIYQLEMKLVMARQAKNYKDEREMHRKIVRDQEIAQLNAALDRAQEFLQTLAFDCASESPPSYAAIKDYARRALAQVKGSR
jgi:hypothetical protein